MKRHYVVEVFLDVDNEDQLNDAYTLLNHQLTQLQKSNGLPIKWEMPTFLTMIEDKKEFDKQRNNEVWDMISQGARFTWLEVEGLEKDACTQHSSQTFAQLPQDLKHLVLTT